MCRGAWGLPRVVGGRMGTVVVPLEFTVFAHALLPRAPNIIRIRVTFDFGIQESTGIGELLLAKSHRVSRQTTVQALALLSRK